MKPKFDPNQSFEVAQTESKPKFDANQPFEETQGPETNTEVESGLRGAAQGLTFNFADEGVGAIEALWETAKGNPNEFGKLYKKYRDESRANFEKAEQDNPVSYKAGEIAGGLATAAVPMGATATLGQAAITGARLGAISSLGQSKAEDAGGMIEDMSAGAAFGAAGGAAFKGLEKGIGAAKNLPKIFANKKANEGLDIANQALSKESGSIPVDNTTVFKDAAQSAKNRMKSFWNPDVDPSFEEFAAIAKKNGIDPSLLPEAVKFGPDSSASRAARNLAEGRFGEETLKKFNKTLDQVRDAYDKKILNYSKGVPTDEVTAGKILRDSYDEGVSKFFDQMDFTHNTVMQQVPGLKITPQSMEKIEASLNGVEKFATGRLERGVTQTQRQQAQQLLNAVSAIRAGNGSYKQTVEALRDIGEAAFQSKNSLADVPVDVSKMRKIYSDLNESLIDTVRSNLGDDIANSLVDNNKAMSEFFGDKALISRIMGDKAISPENAFRSLVLNGDSQKLQALKKILPPEKWDYLKGAVLENITKRDPESNFAFKQLHNSMRNKKSALSAIFEPEELMENAGLVRLGDRFGSPVLSSSGTGASLSFQDIYKVPANLSVDAIALRNANKAAQKSLNPKIEAPMRDVSPRLKDIPVKAGGLLGAPINNDSSTRNPQNEEQGAPIQKKGPEKWANDGAEKLKKSGLPDSAINELKKSKKGKELLMQVSGMDTNSKAFKNIFSQISNKKGGV